VSPFLFASPTFAAFEGFLAASSATATGGELGANPVVSAYPLKSTETIRVDGKLDDDVWSRAETAAGFGQWNPNRGAPASESTSFKVAVDGGALYAAVACHEKDPAHITTTLSRRDRFANSDIVTVYIDPYNDKTTGYAFSTNPVGVQQDQYLYDDGSNDVDWDAVWEVATSRDRDGWYAEFRIPLSSIRYRPGIDRWGLQVIRTMHSRGEDAAWTVWDRTVSGFVSRFGTLSGIPELSSPRQLELLPYGVARTTDPSVAGEESLDGFENFGLDAKYGITSDLSLNATIQPDFGQVEADPAVLNLSPHETFFDEKRPFFIEGNRYLAHPTFNLFYSRRIGTGDENARIRYAAKLTGKTASGISIAGLAASTDVTEEGQSHNFFKDGTSASNYFVTRLGREFDEGNVRFNLMQTAVVNTAPRLSRSFGADRASREAYTTGIDGLWRFADRKYRLEASFVGSVTDPEPVEGDPTFEPANGYGTGGEISFGRNARWDSSVYFRWESDRLDINDIGFLNAPDAVSSGGWVGFDLAPDKKGSWINQGNFNINFFKDWLYGERTGLDLHTGEPVWHYSKGHPEFWGGNVNGWMQLRNYTEVWYGVSFNARGTQRYETRSTVEFTDDDGVGTGQTDAIPGGGPLLDEPETYGFWGGASTDTRKDFVVSFDTNRYWDTAKNLSTYIEVNGSWKQSSAINHSLGVGYNWREDDTQHLANFENPGAGIGGVSYVFGRIKQRTVDLTLRTSVLFSREQSLEIYAQPFIAVGDYSDARELVTPDTYDFRPYTRGGFRAENEDFSFSAVNMNTVYRWEYRPGSTLYLVWAHSRSQFDLAGWHTDRSTFSNDLSGDSLFKNEPENVFLVKVSYWLPI
jgi:hypothetical protein